VVLEPEKWIGSWFTLAGHIDDVGKQLTAGRWVVLLVHRDCDHCIAAVPRYVSAVTATGDRWHLALIEMPPYADAPAAPPWQLAPGQIAGRLDTSRDWFATTPVAVYLNDGKVVAAHEGEAAAAPDRLN
jgi:hypothetical protein